MLRLAFYREKRSLSQAELARVSGVPQQTISGIETEQRTNPGVFTVWQLCKALGCTLEEMIGEANRQKEKTA